MKREYKKIILLSLKIGFGSAIAILIATFFNLDHPTSAGTVTLLSLLTTKWGTLKLSIRRVTTFFLTVCLCFIFFQCIPSHWVAFGIVLACITAYTEKMKIQNTLSVNSLITVHYLMNLDFSYHFMMNEFYLVLIGAIIAFTLNLFHDYSGDEAHLNAEMRYTEEKIQELLGRIVEYMHSMETQTSIWKDLEDLSNQIDVYIQHAIEYQENTFTSLPAYYIHYFEMRKFQCQIIHMLHYEIRAIRNMPKQAEIISSYITSLIPFVTETNVPEIQIEMLHTVLDKFREEDLPKTQEEFESRAILYHILMDLEDFLIVKKDFIDGLNEEQLKLYWKK